MNKQILIFGLAFAVIAGSNLALAEGHGGEGKGPHHGAHHDPDMQAKRQQRMREHLGLTDEQSERMQAIRESNASRDEKRAQMRAVLDDEQRAKWDQMRERHRAAKQAGGKHYRAAHQKPEAYEDN